jgi:oligo-1,6-glucosidase
MAVDSAWWKDGIVYQVWPVSYKDSNGDGHGDIPGIISTLEYLQYLGVDILWVSPTYLSPHKDMGYDVADYEAIDPRYGTLHDAERLIQECHRHQMKIVFDLVINHTSDQHSWFQEAKASKENAKRDWYIWRPARYDERGNRKPPTNWGARLGGSVWTWDEQTQEYYFHMYCPEMPDLNWENDEMRRALYDSAIRFWLDRSVDGFRIDVANKYSKPKEYMDIPITDKTQEYQNAHHVYCNGPRIHEFHREINAILGEYGAISIGGESLPIQLYF